jgi:hypothetical protein
MADATLPVVKPFEYCAGPPPVEFGKSPFHIKGQFYLQALRALERVPNVRLSPELRAFTAQKFLASGWYDVLPFPWLEMAQAEALGKDVREVTREQAHRAAQHALRGVYRLFVPLLLPQSIAMRTLGERMCSGIGQFYDFAPAKMIDPSDSHNLTIERIGVPMCIAEWYAINASNFMEVGLGLAGVKKLSVSYEYRESGSAHGIAVGRVVIRIKRG